MMGVSGPNAQSATWSFPSYIGHTLETLLLRLGCWRLGIWFGLSQNWYGVLPPPLFLEADGTTGRI